VSLTLNTRPTPSISAKVPPKEALKLRERFYQFYAAALKRIIPELRYAQYEYIEMLEQLIPDREWLDLGCGHQITPTWLGELERMIVLKCSSVIGIDVDVDAVARHRSIRAKVIGNFELAPFRSGAFDLITANMVMEHVSDPAAGLQEIGRMLKPGGRFLFHTPNLRSIYVFPAVLFPQRVKNALIEFFEEREEHDTFPTLYRINTPRVIHNMARACGFRVVELRLLNSSGRYTILGPVAIILELLMLKILAIPAFRSWRSNMIVVLEKAAVP
jgi:SAM-dependent methyltransferase